MRILVLIGDDFFFGRFDVVGGILVFVATAVAAAAAAAALPQWCRFVLKALPFGSVRGKASDRAVFFSASFGRRCRCHSVIRII